MLFAGTRTGADEAVALNPGSTHDSGAAIDESAYGTGGVVVNNVELDEAIDKTPDGEPSDRGGNQSVTIDKEPDKAADGDMSDTGGDQSSTSSDDVIEVMELDNSEIDKAVHGGRDMSSACTVVIMEVVDEVAGNTGKSL